MGDGVVVEAMMKRVHWLWVPLAALLLSVLACGRGQSATPTVAPQPTATYVPTPIPPAATPANLPADSDLRELILYANALGPYLQQASQILARDGEILKEAEGGNDDALCDGRLAADNDEIKGLIEQMRSLVPPADAQAIHDLLVKSGDAWGESLDNVESFCQTHNQLYKIPAILKYWEAAMYLQDAGNRFWLLLITKGVEDWVLR
jgi:hypothetical protein